MNRPIRPDVTLVSRIFAPEPAAASFRLEALVKALAKHGAKVQVLTSIPAPGTDYTARASVEQDPDLSPQVAVRRVQALRDNTGYIRGYLPYMSFDIPAFFRLLFAPAPRVYVSEPPPTTGAMLRVLAALRRRPYVYYAADVWSDAAASSAPPLVVRVLRALESFALRGASRVVAVSTGVATRCQELGARRVALVENGIDTEVFSAEGALPDPLAGMSREDIADNDWLVYAGTASEWQGAEIFATAFAEIAADFPKSRLLFLGQGSSFAAMREIAAGLEPGRMVFGQVDPAQAAAWQRHAQACLVSIKPGLGYDFAYPTKVLAGLSCDTPVVYAGVGPAAQDLHENQLGLAVPYDLEAVKLALTSVLEHRLRTADLRAWVLANRSLAATGQKSSRVVLAATHEAPTEPKA